jgi:cytokinin dehydrogenase
MGCRPWQLALNVRRVLHSKRIRRGRRLSRNENLLQSNGQWFNPHPWLLTFLRGSNAEQVAKDVLVRLTNEDVGPFGRITFYSMLTTALRTPLVRLPDENVAFPFNLVRIPASNDAAKAERMVVKNRVLYDRIRNAGAVLCPVSALPHVEQ